MTKAQLARLVDIVEEARYAVRQLTKIGHMQGAPIVLTHTLLDWSMRRGGLKHEGLWAENN